MTEFIDHPDAVQPRTGYTPGDPCMACHGPLEKSYSPTWCDCHLCWPCARGIVWSCPVCGSHPPETTDVDVSAAHPITEPDHSALWWLAAMFSLVASLFLMAWLVG
jgi:hypothetical protein